MSLEELLPATLDIDLVSEFSHSYAFNFILLINLITTLLPHVVLSVSSHMMYSLCSLCSLPSALPPLRPLTAHLSSQMQEEDVEPEVLDVVCRVCEDCWASDRLEEHNELCTVLQQVKGGCSRCTVLCTVMQVYDVL